MRYNSLVSIIVPVYNAEKYLCKCIDSILNQTYKNIEVILINDGSTDNSGKICDEYRQKDKRVVVKHIKNSGPSVARNIGIEIARGQYIQFVDSDDYVELQMTEKLIQEMSEGVQLVICGYKLLYLSDDNVVIEERKPPKVGKYEKMEFIKNFGVLFKENFINSPCNKLYITEVIKKHNIRFIHNLHMGEDLLFNLEYINNCDAISIIDTPLYNYTKINKNSLTNSLMYTFKGDLFENQQMLFQKIREFLLKYNSYVGQNKDLVEIVYTQRIISCLERLFYENRNFGFKAIRKQIYNIIDDEYVKKNIGYFRIGNIQKNLIGVLAKRKLTIGIYIYFKIKLFLINYMKPMFRLLKRITKTHSFTVNLK